MLSNTKGVCRIEPWNNVVPELPNERDLLAWSVLTSRNPEKELNP